MESFDKLLEIMAKLRSPEGCPWDREQDHKSLKPYLIEEAYEVLDAIDREESPGLKEELGDLLLHIVFHAQMAREANEFDIDDVINSINNKMIERHPHVFDKQDNGLTSDQVLNRWENIKADTSARKKYYVLNGLPSSMPALLKAYRIQEKVARFGFDWKNPLEIFDKIDEEKSEIMQAIREEDTEKLEEEMGDILFTIVNLCRHYKVVPEMALSATCEKFRKRFSMMEDYIREDGLELGKLDVKRLDEYWERAKRDMG